MTAGKFRLATSGLMMLLVAYGLPRQSAAAQPGKQERIDKLAAALDTYWAAAGKLDELDKTVSKLSKQFSDAPAAHRHLRSQAESSSRRLSYAKRALVEANDDFEGKENEKRKNRTLQQKLDDVAKREDYLAYAQRSYEKYADELAKFPAQVAQLKKDLADARNNHRDQAKQTDPLRGQWLSQMDFAGDWSKPEHESVVRTCNQRTAVNPLDGAAIVSRSLSHFWLGDPGRAIKELSPLIDQKCDLQGLASAIRGLARSWQGESAGPTADFDRALRIAPQQACVYVCRGWAHWRRHEFTATAAAFQKANELDKQSPVPHRLLGLLYASAAGATSSDKAIEHAKKACELAADEWSGLDSLAAAQAQAGRFEEAVATIQQAADLVSAEKRQQCLDRKALYVQRQPLRLDWK